MRITPFEPFGVEVTDLAVATASEADLAAFEAAFREHCFVVMRTGGLTPEDQVALIGRLGEVAVETNGGGKTRLVEHDPAAPRDTYEKGEMYFHYDLCSNDDWPYQILSLYAEIVTETGGETLFTHTGRVCERLDPELKAQIAGRRAVHLFDPYHRGAPRRPTEANVGPFAERGVHDMVWPHPYGHGEAMSVAQLSVTRVVGMSQAESDALFERLFAALYDPAGLYEHRWEVGDLLIWDNRVVQHARRDFDPAQARRLRRVVVADGERTRRRYQRWADQVPA